MSEDRRRILEMLAEGKLQVADAEKLLAAIGETPEKGEPVGGEVGVVRARPRYLRVSVEDRHKNGEDGPPTHVNVRVPLQLLRAGIKLGALIPRDAQEQMKGALREKGIDFDPANLSPETVEQLIDSLGDLSVDVDDEGTKVKVFCES